MGPPVVVLGAGGRTGAECVARLEEQGKAVRAVVRDPAKYASLSSRKGVEVVAGDVGSVESLRKVLRGASGIIYAASTSTYFGARAVDCEGVGNVAAAAKEAGGVPMVLVSSCMVTPKNRWNPIRLILNTAKWGLMDAKLEGEKRLRSSGVRYTVVRPGGLVNEPAGKAQLIAAQGDTQSGRVSRGDVAAVCVAALTDPAARNVTLELLSKPADSPAPLDQQLKGLFAGLKPDEPAA